ncbi:MAG TPA: ROK family protein [Armatimonadota bacterium]|jgi:glucokinase
MAKKPKHFVGVDVGGTKIYGLAADAAGEILGRYKRKTDPQAPLVDQVAEVVEGVLQASGLTLDQVAGLGVAMPAVVDSCARRVVHAPNLANADPDLIEQLQARFPVPISLGNDVNLGTLAEVWRGAGRGCTSVVGIFVGTGIGGGVVVDGTLLAGSEDQAGEIGHLVLAVDGPVCGCGNRGCFEALASRTAIEKAIREGLAAGRTSSLKAAADHGRITSGALRKALDEGDELAVEIMTREGHYLGQGALTIRHILDPELLILGGGVVEACGDFLLPLIEAELRGDQLQRSRDVLRVVLSELGDDAVALGAAALARGASTKAPRCDVVEARPEAAPRAKQPKLPAYPKLEDAGFGAVRVDGKEVATDLYVRADGSLVERKKKPIRKKYGSSHLVDKDELRKVLKGKPELLLVGSGHSRMVRLTDEAWDYLQGLGVEWHLLSTPEAIAAYNEARGTRALLLHVTC